MTTRAPTVLKTEPEFEMHMEIAWVISGFTMCKVKLDHSYAWCQHYCAIEIVKKANIPSYHPPPCSYRWSWKSKYLFKTQQLRAIYECKRYSVHIKIIEPGCKLFVVCGSVWWTMIMTVIRRLRVMPLKNVLWAFVCSAKKERFLIIVNSAHTLSKDELAAIQILIAEDLSTNTCKYMQNIEINICILLRG